MTAEPVSSGVRAVLDAPRGRRFSKPGYPAPQTREQRLLAQMEGNPRVAYRQTHGVLPAWMHVQAQRIAAREQSQPSRRDRPETAPVPRPRPAPDDGPAPARQPRQTPPQPPPADKPPLPRRRSKRPHGHRPHSHRPHGHRKPRRWARTVRTGPAARLLAAYTLASGAGALAHHLATTLA